MSLSAQVISSLVDLVLDAQDRPHTIAKLTLDHPEMTIEDGYAVQHELRRRRIQRGERLIGLKGGLTSKAKMIQMGVHSPSFGFLTNVMASPENGALAANTMIHPRVEAEIAFVTNRELAGPNCTIDQVLDATEYVIPAVEVIDSRYEKFQLDLISAIADNASSCRYVTGGRPRGPRELDLRTVGVVIEKNGVIQALGAGAAVLNHPANSIVMLLQHLATTGETLPAGSFVMTGGITEAIPVTAGDSVIARFQEMGSVSLHFV
jgi:2-oxo-3-hexenedioate decarboxylase